MVNTDALKTQLESETDLHWTVSTDKPGLKKFVAVSFEYVIEYRDDRDNWTFRYEDMANPDKDAALGPIQTDHVVDEFRGFVSETFDQ